MGHAGDTRRRLHLLPERTESLVSGVEVSSWQAAIVVRMGQFQSTGRTRMKFISWYDNCDDISGKRVLLEDNCYMVAPPENDRIECHKAGKVDIKVGLFHGVNLKILRF